MPNLRSHIYYSKTNHYTKPLAQLAQLLAIEKSNLFNKSFKTKLKMKNSLKHGVIKSSLLVFLLSITSFITWAQDSTVSATTTTASSTSEAQTWYAEPWVWVVGGAILILLIIALTRGNSSTTGRTDKVTITKTTSSDNV